MYSVILVYKENPKFEDMCQHDHSLITDIHRSQTASFYKNIAKTDFCHDAS